MYPAYIVVVVVVVVVDVWVISAKTGGAVEVSPVRWNRTDNTADMRARVGVISVRRIARATPIVGVARLASGKVVEMIEALSHTNCVLGVLGWSGHRLLSRKEADHSASSC